MENELVNLLGIDTSTDRATVTLSWHGQTTTKEHVGTQSHAQTLLTSIDLLLGEAQVELKQLDGIVFGQGPGSFTGLRVACSIAKGLGYAQDLPLYPVSTLAAVVSTAFIEKTDTKSAVLALIDARMNQVYWAFAANSTSLVLKEQVSSIEEIAVSLDASQSICLAGVGWERYEHDLPAEILARVTQRLIVYPMASAMIRLVEQGIIAPRSAAEALPVYIRDKVTS